MPKPPVFARTAANSSIGLGHLIRTTALADILSEQFDPVFILQNTPPDISAKFISSTVKTIILPFTECNSDKEIAFLKTQGILKNAILIFDGYEFDAEYQKKFRTSDFRIVYIDDLLKPGYCADLVINQADFVSANDYGTNSVKQFLLGPKFALLRPPFLNAARNKHRKIDKVHSVFVSFGGADANNVTFKVVKTLCAFSELQRIHVLSSSVNTNINEWKNLFPQPERVRFHQDLSSTEVCELMQSCDLALCPSSSLSLELCAVGILLLTGTTAGNQNGYYRSIIHHKAAIGIGDWLNVSETDLALKLKLLIHGGQGEITEMLSAQRQYIDGLSGQRILNAFSELIK